MDTKTAIYAIAGVSILIILVLIISLLKMASYADKLEEKLLGEEGYLDGKD